MNTHRCIDFSYNWNNKLDCNVFTTLRLNNPDKYQIGETYQVTLKGKPKGIATIIDIKVITLDQLNEWTSMIDTGYSLRETKDIIMRMYSKIPLVKFQKFNLILLKKID